MDAVCGGRDRTSAAVFRHYRVREIKAVHVCTSLIRFRGTIMESWVLQPVSNAQRWRLTDPQAGSDEDRQNPLQDRPTPPVNPPAVDLDAGPANNAPTSTSQAPAAHRPYSSGTLRIDQGGRSRYLGPTAALRWLRDVRFGAFDVSLMPLSKNPRRRRASLRSRNPPHPMVCRKI